jgi:hypothetical protein
MTEAGIALTGGRGAGRSSEPEADTETGTETEDEQERAVRTRRRRRQNGRSERVEEYFRTKRMQQTTVRLVFLDSHGCNCRRSPVPGLRPGNLITRAA